MDTKSNTVQTPEVVTSIRLPREVHTRIKALAEREHRTLSGEIRKLVDDRLAAVDALDAAA